MVAAAAAAVDNAFQCPLTREFSDLTSFIAYSIYKGSNENAYYECLVLTKIQITVIRIGYDATPK